MYFAMQKLWYSVVVFKQTPSELIIINAIIFMSILDKVFHNLNTMAVTDMWKQGLIQVAWRLIRDTQI